MSNLSRLRKLQTISPVMSAEQSLVIKKPLETSGQNLWPLVIKPRFKGVDLVDWVKKNKAEFDSALVRYGGLLLRGFDTDSLEKFGRFVDSFDSDPLSYMFRSSPRYELDKKVKNVYNSTTYPKEESIRLHNESSYSRTWGMKIMFCCLTPASQDGETPIADSRQILRDIDPSIVEKFRQRGVMYRRTLIKDIGMSWQEVFQTEDPAVVKDICRQNDIYYEFVSDDHLEIEWVKQAVYLHPVSGQATWFNHIYFFNKYSRYQDLGIDLDDQAPADLIHSNTLYGDGTELSKSEYLNIKEAYEKNTISFKYEKGDIIFLDNMLAAHGRNPYDGDRLIATAIIEPAGDQ